VRNIGILHNTPNAEVQLGHLLMDPKEEEEEYWDYMEI
jgi:hypothetical protein